VIVPDLQSLAVPIDSLRKLKGNPRVGDVDAVARSLKAFGQRKPIVVNQSTNEIEAGNHTFAAAKQLGWTEIAVVWVQDDPTTAKAFALADNRTAELGGYDDKALASMIEDVLNEDIDLLHAASFTEADLEALLKEDDDPILDPPEADDKPALLTLHDRFLVPPFTVLSARDGWWQDRKNAWISLGLEGELGRDDKPRTWFLAPPPGKAKPGRILVDPDAAEARRSAE
jgi:hypothetical protein